MAKTHIDLSRAEQDEAKQLALREPHARRGQPIPAVGDDLVVTKGDRTIVVRVERRLFQYLEDSLYLQLYFTNVE